MPAMVDACAEEFAEIDKQLDAAVELMGEYVWKQYDVLVLPPSFPYGGILQRSACILTYTGSLENWNIFRINLF